MTPRPPRIDRLVAWTPVLLLGSLAAVDGTTFEASQMNAEVFALKNVIA